MSIYRTCKQAIKKTGIADSTYQAGRFKAQRSYLLSSIGLCMILFTMLSISEFFIIDDPERVLKIRLIFAPSIILLMALILVGASFRLFYFLATLVFSLSGIYFIIYVYDGKIITLAYCTAVIAMTLFVMMALLKISIHFTALPSLITVLFFCFATNEQPEAEWLSSAGAISSLWIAFLIGETVRSVDEYRLFNEQKRINKHSLEQTRWSHMTGRLLRHELANQLIGLSSSLDMLARHSNTQDQVTTTNARRTISDILDDVNELALASEWSAAAENSGTSANILEALISSFANYDIQIAADSVNKNALDIAANKHVVIYAFNQLAKVISSFFSTQPIRCTARIPKNQEQKVVLEFSVMITATARDSEITPLTSEAINKPVIHSMISLLASQRIKVALLEQKNRLAMQVARIENH